MANLPTPPNTTCDIYHFGNAPPAAPDVAGVSILLTADFERRMETGEGDGAGFRWTHVAWMPKGTDIRDGYALGSTGGNFDRVYVPDKNGTAFVVRYVQKMGFKQMEMRKVYLDRKLPTWPSNEV